MSKSWGKQNGIAPILYAYPGSLITGRLATLMDHVLKTVQDDSHRSDVWERFLDFASFVKPYEGNLWRQSGPVNNVRFYDEREWRFVPTMSNQDRKVLAKDQFLDDETRHHANRKLAESFRIGFEPNNIKYLIVRLEEEIVPFIREVERIKGKYGYDEVKLVTSRVISAEQIRSDF